MKLGPSTKRFEYHFTGKPPLSFPILGVAAILNGFLFTFGDLLGFSMPRSGLLRSWIDHAFELNFVLLGGLFLIAFLHRGQLVRVPTKDPGPATFRDMAAIAVAVVVFYFTRGWIAVDLPQVDIRIPGLGDPEMPATRLDILAVATLVPLALGFVGSMAVFAIYLEVSKFWGVMMGSFVIGLAPMISLGLLASAPPPPVTTRQRIFVVVWAAAVAAAALAWWGSSFRAS